MFLDLLAAVEFLIRIILPVKLLLRRQDFKMTRKVTGESKIKEVFKYAGKKLLVVHFFDKERYCKGLRTLRMKNSAGSFYLAEMNKLPELPNNKEQIKSITKLIDKYMPTSVTRLVFFRNGKRVIFKDYNQDKYFEVSFSRLTMNGLIGYMMTSYQPNFLANLRPNFVVKKTEKLIKIRIGLLPVHVTSIGKIVESTNSCNCSFNFDIWFSRSSRSTARFIEQIQEWVFFCIFCKNVI